MHPFVDRFAVLGFPDSCQRYHSHAPAPWSAATLARVRALGFTGVQLNLAWGARPDDEPLNLEDLLETEADPALRQAVPLGCRPGAEALERRRALIRERLAMARAAGLRTILHVGAPFNAHARYGDGPPNCIADDAVGLRHEQLLERVVADFPRIDDLWLYTYDQDAWLCSEFGPCPRCLGRPLHERLTPFLDRLRRTWRRLSPKGRLWWEPWELSAGQVHACVERLEAEGLGLALHANVAECMAAVVADRWLENIADLGRRRGMPVTVEWFLGGLSEETEPLAHLAHPLCVWHGLQRIARVAGVTGIKEYYGLLPEREDPNLAATALFLAEPDLSDDEALRRLAQPYGAAAAAVVGCWREASLGMEVYPWDVSWLGRQIGRAVTDHSLAAAILRPMLCPTPSWQSTRGTVFMRTEDTRPHPWMLEDVQLRCRQAAEHWRDALALGFQALPAVPMPLAADLAATLADLSRLQRRALAHAYHLRATCIAIALRTAYALSLELPRRSLEELRQTLIASRDNHAAECQAAAAENRWQEIDQAIAALDADPKAFLERWLVETPDRCSKGPFSMTSA